MKTQEKKTQMQFIYFKGLILSFKESDVRNNVILFKEKIKAHP